MTVSSTTTKNSYSGNGSNDTFAYGFKIFDDDDITVIIRTDATGTETVKTKTTHYTVTNVGNTNGGNVVFTGGNIPASGETVVLRRTSAQTQTTDYVANDPFPAATHEDALDKLTFLAQEQQEELDRAIKISRTNTMTSTEFTVGATDRANKVLAFDSSGEIQVTQEIGTFRGNWAASTAYEVRDLVKDTSTNNIFIVNAAHTSSGAQPLTTNANSAKYDLIVDAATATTSATAAAASATAAASSATAAANSESAASTSETNAATSATNAATSETNAGNSATSAASSATSATASASTATTKASEASTSATNAATSAATASTQATNASNSASAAGTSETNAATSASTATTKASEAATSATNAATSASTATTKASEAATSATNAASSATAAAASQTSAAASAASAASAFDNFDDTYLGSKTSNPTVDNDGDALVAGALYFNSTANEMRVYDGANWIAATSAGNVSLILYEYTATSGQTTFSGSDDNSATLSYTVDNLQVVMNGVILDPSDYTATSGTSVVLASGAATNDLINIYAFKSFTTADMVSKTNGGTFAGNVTFADTKELRFGDDNDFSFEHNNATGENLLNLTAGPLEMHQAGTNSVLQVHNDGTNHNQVVQVFKGNSQHGHIATDASKMIISGQDGLDITTSANNGDITLDPDGTGDVIVTSAETSSTANLTVQNTNASGQGAVLRVKAANTNANSKMVFDDGGTESGFVFDGGANVVQHFVNGSERLRVDSSGNVGIGTSPTAPLHVKAGNGTIKLHEGAAADNKYGMLEVSNGKLILHSDAQNVENSSTMQFHLDNIEYARFKDNGQLAIGSDGSFRPTEKLSVKASGDVCAMWCTSTANSGINLISFYQTGSQTYIGAINAANQNSVQYNSASDVRLKENIVGLSDAITRLKQLSPKRFNWIASDNNDTVDGFIAHEVQTVVPEAVSGTHNGVDDDGNPEYQGMDPSKLVPLLTGALQEAISKIETLETKVAALEAGE